MAQINHPYFPRDLNINNYKPNSSSLEEILGVFFGLVIILIIVVLLLSNREPLRTRLKICWFVASGLIHIILEGYFSYYKSDLASHDTYLGQMWKEYGKGDSRYIFGDSCIVGIETITAVIDGPLCLLTALAFTYEGISQFRYIFQIVVSCFQLYGDSLYYFTEILENFKHCDMWSPLHFWFYVVFLNSIWIILPFACIIDASWNLSRNQLQVDKTSNRKKNK